MILWGALYYEAGFVISFDAKTLHWVITVETGTDRTNVKAQSKLIQSIALVGKFSQEFMLDYTKRHGQAAIIKALVTLRTTSRATM